jgi:penicillin-binding protein 1B
MIWTSFLARIRRLVRGVGAFVWRRKWWTLGVVLVLMLTYAVYIEMLVHRHLTGRLWPEPARVYASPTELYVGERLSTDELIEDLDRLGYREREIVDESGTFARERDTVRIHTRGFLFPEGYEPATVLRATFDEGRISRLVADSLGADLPLTRLDPLLIGSIYPRTGEDRLILSREEFPPLLVEILLAVEDRNFYDHGGIDPRGLLRALIANVRSRRLVQGGSTLTQQLVKNRMLDAERSLGRKINELFMALAVERRLSKDEILHLYLNEIYMGQDGHRPIHGFGLASHFYFAKPLQELELPELALLVGMIKGPSLYDPRRNPERARQRRNLVLTLLADEGVVTPEAAEDAREWPLGVSERPERSTVSYPAMMDVVRRQLLQDYPEKVLDSEGLRIFTTLSPRVQARAEQALREGLDDLERSTGRPTGSLEGAVVVTSVNGAELLAVVGGRQTHYEGFDRAVDALRPVGSLLKPAIYLRALQTKKYTWATAVLDSALTVDMPNGDLWQPQNHDLVFRGRVPLYQALEHSYNLPTVRVALDVGMDSIVDTLHRLGLRQDLPPYPSLALGAVELSPLDMAQMYNTLAAGGFQSRVNALRDVLQADGKRSKRYPLHVEQAVDRRLVYLVNEVLVRSTREGTAAPLQRLLPDLTVAGKTGTSDAYRDSWFAGFTNDHVAVVRVGHDDATPAGLSGASGALPIWARLMSALPTRSYAPVRPSGVEPVWFDPQTGLRSGEDCPGAVALPFLKGTEPEQGECGKESFGTKAKRWLKGIFGGD